MCVCVRARVVVLMCEDVCVPVVATVSFALPRVYVYKCLSMCAQLSLVVHLSLSFAFSLCDTHTSTNPRTDCVFFHSLLSTKFPVQILIRIRTMAYMKKFLHRECVVPFKTDKANKSKFSLTLTDIVLTLRLCDLNFQSQQ